MGSPAPLPAGTNSGAVGIRGEDNSDEEDDNNNEDDALDVVVGSIGSKVSAMASSCDC